MPLRLPVIKNAGLRVFQHLPIRNGLGLVSALWIAPETHGLSDERSSSSLFHTSVGPAFTIRACIRFSADALASASRFAQPAVTRVTNFFSASTEVTSLRLHPTLSKSIWLIFRIRLSAFISGLAVQKAGRENSTLRHDLANHQILSFISTAPVDRFFLGAGFQKNSEPRVNWEYLRSSADSLFKAQPG